MRHAAVIQPRSEKPPLLIGLGETHADAMAGARAWFSAEMDRTNSNDWPRLFALQDHLAVYAEDEFAASMGVALDDWLARQSSAGAAPTMTAAAPADDAWMPLPTRKVGSPALPHLITYSLAALIFLGVIAGVRYGGTRILNRQFDAITSSSNAFDLGSGPAYNADFETFDPDDLRGDLAEPWDSSTRIDGVLGP